ncbi:hypothetical protein OsI_11976 [Oryza sativa Indica Group]|uniref:Uncharacterized protein n=2 Tax=Oryza TaxID=4527 RepID=A0A0E0GNZ3_ORYNI|nr:hypothetical protein OsI_11976 [Oryza sativa Indica Group]
MAEGCSPGTRGRTTVAVHGAGAYRFTEERLEELEREVDGEAAAAGWPGRVSGHAPFEEDVLVLTRRRGASPVRRVRRVGLVTRGRTGVSKRDFHLACVIVGDLARAN